MAALELVAATYRLLGRRASLLLMSLAAVYFALLAGTARRGSRLYLDTLWALPEGRRVLGRRPRFRDVIRHMRAFAINIFDRIVGWSGSLDEIEFRHVGSEVLFDLARDGKGGFLVGAHQGSFDMMRLLASRYDVCVNVLMFTKHATRINTFFEKLDPGSRVRVLEIEPGSMKTAFDIRACIARGEFVGILADRIHPGGRDRPVRIDFLGRPAVFPLTPFVLACILECPVVFTQCIRIDDRTYESSAKVLGRDLDPRMPSRKRADVLLRAFVAELEKTCLRAPYQWFNFFDYWADRDAGDA